MACLMRLLTEMQATSIAGGRGKAAKWFYRIVFEESARKKTLHNFGSVFLDIR